MLAILTSQQHKTDIYSHMDVPSEVVVRSEVLIVVGAAVAVAAAAIRPGCQPQLPTSTPSATDMFSNIY